MRRSLALLPVLGYLRAAAFSGVGTSPVARHRLAPSPVGRRTALTRARLVVDPVAAVDLASHASAALDLPSGLVAFADQGGNLAGKFFMFSLPSYVAFLYFLGYEETKAPRLSYVALRRAYWRLSGLKNHALVPLLLLPCDRRCPGTSASSSCCSS